MRSLRSAALFALVPLALTSCTTSMSVRSLEPGPVHVGATDHLTYYGGEGRRSAREFVAAELRNQIRSGAYFSFEDHGEEGADVRIVGRTVELTSTTPLEPCQMGVRVDVLEWNSYREERDVQKKNAKGETCVEKVAMLVGHTLFSITLFDVDGNAILAEAEYEGHSATEDFATPREDVIEAAGREAIAGFLADITPVHVTSRVRLDEEDEGQKTILETAKNGSVALAAEDLRHYAESQPNNASAAYNLAVLLEATGEFAEALEWYDRALALGGKDYYTGARANCARRLAAAESLNAERVGY